MEYSYYTTGATIVKVDENGEAVWQLNGKQVDALLDDQRRMENLLTDLVKPEEMEKPCKS